MHNKSHDEECELLFFVIIEMGKMGSGRALQKSLFICNACGYKAKLVLGFFVVVFKLIFSTRQNKTGWFRKFTTTKVKRRTCYVFP